MAGDGLGNTASNEINSSLLYDIIESMKKTKVMCTIGPASWSKTTLKHMLDTGMDAIRINTSHGSINDYQQIIDNTRAVSDIPIVLDLIGPEIRIRSREELALKKGMEFVAGFNKRCDNYFTYDFYDQVRVGEKILLADGLIKTKIIGKRGHKLTLKSLTDALLHTNKSAAVPGKRFDVKIFCKKDRQLMKFASGQELDYISLSFTRSVRDIRKLRRELKDPHIGVISKIESPDGVENVDSIIDESEGVMVARGDLGVQIPAEKLPLIQKDIIHKCNVKGKTVIVATEMLKSMVEHSRPTRAEVADVANAVLDGTDAVMLSDETTIGKYPVESVNMMKRILLETEPCVVNKVPLVESEDVSESIAKAVYSICSHLPIDKVVTLTNSGYTAKHTSRFRLKQDIIAVTMDERVKRKLNLVYGVKPVVYAGPTTRNHIYESARFLYKNKLIRKSDLVLFTAGVHSCQKHQTNLIEVHHTRDLLECRVIN